MYFIPYIEFSLYGEFWFVFRALCCQSSYQRFCCGQWLHFYQCWSHTQTSGCHTGHVLSKTILSCAKHSFSYYLWFSYCHLQASPGIYCVLICTNPGIYQRFMNQLCEWGSGKIYTSWDYIEFPNSNFPVVNPSFVLIYTCFWIVYCNKTVIFLMIISCLLTYLSYLD